MAVPIPNSTSQSNASMPNFKQDFIAQGVNFSRNLTIEEKAVFKGFPNANLDTITFLGVGAIRPSDENCKYYQCLSSGPVYMYDATTSLYVGTMHSVASDMRLMQYIWDLCHSGKYNCEFRGHFGATYNCIGWSLGISKWLNPGEITSYIKMGMPRNVAVDKFIAAQNATFPQNHKSNIDGIVDELHSVSAPHGPIANNTVAFFFDNDDCKHGARYLETLDNTTLDKWTSKLGSSITISHDLSDLMGVNSIYGNDLCYAETA
ncbi:conserved hypothetical protein [Alphaproteobacteria bacterium]